MKGTGPFLVTGYELALVPGVQVDPTHNTIANRVLLQGAKVGDVQTNTLAVQNGGTYANKYAFPTTMPALPTLAPVFPGTAALTVNPSSTVAASPGAYGAVSIGTKGILRLQGGVYHVASLQLDDDARIEAQAAVQIRVAGRVTGRLSTLARVWIGAATGVTLTAADLRIEVSGKNGTGGGLTETPKAATFGNDATILGVILVPNGTLQTGQRNTVTGALVGHDVYVDMDSKVNFQSGVAGLKCAQFCNDGNPCTKDTCTGEVCSYPAAASGTSCSDGNTCNGAETCDGKGTCKAGTPVACSPLDQCHAAGMCDPATGVCSNPTKADGTACNDANACTVSDICRSGVCSGTTYSCDDGLACTTDTCNGTGGCTHTVTAGNCAINGACYAAGATNPANACQQCTPATSQTAWSLKSSGTVCRAAAGACDVAEVCNGTSPACPPDALLPPATVCRASAGVCDVAETCTGTSAACPADGFVPPTTVCRASAGVCDVAETCTGASAACPNDLFVPASTMCRASAGPCDVPESCTGISPACPPDGFLQASLACRPAAGLCDAVEVCSGTSAACPPDAFLPPSTICRPSTSPCDPAENCTGSGPACPSDINTGSPAAPAPLLASSSPDGVVLTWTASPGATSYNVKRGTASGGPYTTIASPTGSGYSDASLPAISPPGLTSATMYYYVVTAVAACGESGNSNEVSGNSVPPTPPRTLPPPPMANGCYVWTPEAPAGWKSIPCTPPDQRDPHFSIPMNSEPTIVSPPPPPSTATKIPFQFGQVEATFVTFDSEKDVLATANHNNQLSLQANTNTFTIANNSIYGSTGDTGWLQFVLQTADMGNYSGKPDNAICIWQVNSNQACKIQTDAGMCIGCNADAGPCSNNGYNSSCVGGGSASYKIGSRSSSTFNPFDFATIAGSTFTDPTTGQPKIGIVAQFSWFDPNDDFTQNGNGKGLYSLVVDDLLGLGGSWTEISGTFIGQGSGSVATFGTTSSVLTRTLAGSCNTSGSGPVVDIPWPGTCPYEPLLLPHTGNTTSNASGSGTSETNNLTIVGSATKVASLEPDLVFLEYYASQSGTCQPATGVNATYAFLQDTAEDVGVVPSNIGGQPFWESPDIYFVPSGSPAPTTGSVSGDTLIDLGQPYDFYVRAHNDFGCRQVQGVKARVFLADPSALFQSWSLGEITGGVYSIGQGQTPDAQGGVTVPAYGQAMIGPFKWTAPTADAGVGSLHKCLLAAIEAPGEPAPANPGGPPNSLPAAYDSYQVAQRNLQLSDSCSFQLPNTQPQDGKLVITLQESGATPDTTVGNIITASFSDPSGDWYSKWHAALLAGTASGFTVTNDSVNQVTTVTLATTYVSLPEVTLAGNTTSTTVINIELEPELYAVTSVALDAKLRDSAGGLVIDNGTTCLFDPGED